jgi:twitching motility protein PilT
VSSDAASIGPSTSDPAEAGAADRAAAGANAEAQAPAGARAVLPVYMVDGRLESILDLLGRFCEERWQRNGISRLADLHIKVGVPVVFRLDGELTPLQNAEVLTKDHVLGLIHPLLRPDQVEKLSREFPQDVDAAFHMERDGGMNFRINAFHDRDGLAAVIRSLPRTVPSIHTLGFPDPQVVKNILNLRQGLVVITGITGSGKSTTIASLLAELNKQSALRVITLEDPVEFVMKNEKCLVSQREIGWFFGGVRVGRSLRMPV